MWCHTTSLVNRSKAAPAEIRHSVYQTQSDYTSGGVRVTVCLVITATVISKRINRALPGIHSHQEHGRWVCADGRVSGPRSHLPGD